MRIRESFSWAELQQHFKARLDAIHNEYDAAENDRAVAILQGRAQEIKQLLNLPHTLAILHPE